MSDRPTDIIDQAAILSEQLLTAQLKVHADRQARLPKVSEFFCIECAEPIPEARRQAVVGCQRCIECQQVADYKNKGVIHGVWK